MREHFNCALLSITVLVCLAKSLRWCMQSIFVFSFDLLLYFTQSCQTVSLAQHNQHDRVFYILYPPDPSMCILYVCFALLNHNCVQLVLLEYMNYSCLNTHKNCFIRIFLGNTSYLPTVTCMPFWQYNLFNWPSIGCSFCPSKC